MNTLQSTSKTNRIALTLDHVYVIAALTLLALRPLLTSVLPHDFWWHIATGRLIASTGTIPAVDSFSYTQAGQPFFNQGWLAQLLMYGLHQLGGVELLLIVQSLIIALAYGLLLWLAIRRSGRLRLSVVLLLLTTLPLSFDNWTIRPQSYVFPLFAAYLFILSAYRFGWFNRLWLLPLLMVLWANMHGSFVLGLALIGITWFGEALKRIRPVASATSNPTPRLLPVVLWGTISALAVLINPRGFELYGYVRNLLGSNQVTTLVTEWAPPTIRDTGGMIFFLFVLGLALVLIYAQKRPDVTDLLVVGAFLWLALGAVRSIVWFGFVATPLLIVQAATLLSPPRGPAFRGSPLINGAIVGLFGLMVLIALPWIKPAVLPPPQGDLLDPENPVVAVEALKSLPNPPQRLFHAMGYGSYLIYHWPDRQVFIDPRIELYPYEQWTDYLTLSRGDNLAALSAQYQFDGMLLNVKEQGDLIEVLRNDPSWRIAYEDPRTVLFGR